MKIVPLWNQCSSVLQKLRNQTTLRVSLRVCFSKQGFPSFLIPPNIISSSCSQKSAWEIAENSSIKTMTTGAARSLKRSSVPCIEWCRGFQGDETVTLSWGFPQVDEQIWFVGTLASKRPVSKIQKIGILSIPTGGPTMKTNVRPKNTQQFTGQRNTTTCVCVCWIPTDLTYRTQTLVSTV